MEDSAASGGPERIASARALGSGRPSFGPLAALVWADEAPTGQAFVCLDDRLREAAQAEGFSVLPEGA